MCRPTKTCAARSAAAIPSVVKTWGIWQLRPPQKGLRAALALIRERQPQAKIVWVSSTPLKDPELTAKAQKLNEIGRKVAAEFTQDVDDLFALLDPLDRAQNWSDTFHHKGAVREKEADQVAASVLSVLAR